MSIVTQTLIPLWATWIGIVWAFYFGKSDFDAATKSYNTIINKLSPVDKLKNMPITKVMMQLDKVISLNFEDVKNITIKSILEDEAFLPYIRYDIIDNKSTEVHNSTP